jgi:serine/threonine protein phosphatase PrpC
MGGHIGGAMASARAVAIVTLEVLQGLIMPILRGDPPAAIQDLMREAVLTANRRILEEAAKQQNDMGTTLTAALLLAGRCYQAHVGDSRLYTHTAAGLECRTRDHSMVARLLELGQITPEEAHHHPKRNYLYQSVGQQDDIEVESDSFALDDCDFLFICSDGLWGVVEEEVLLQSLATGREPQRICDDLVAQANAAGGEDNISVIVVALPQV